VRRYSQGKPTARGEISVPETCYPPHLDSLTDRPEIEPGPHGERPGNNRRTMVRREEKSRCKIGSLEIKIFPHFNTIFNASYELLLTALV